MKVALISLSTPTVYNQGAASALPYHLLKYRAENIQVEIWSFNINHIKLADIPQIETELNVKVHLLKLPIWISLVGSLLGKLLRIILKYPFLYYLSIPDEYRREIKSKSFDFIWIYGEELANLATLFEDKQIVITTPDCEAMYYYRVLALQKVCTKWSSLIRCMMMYAKYVSMVQKFPIGSKIKYHLVGLEDRNFLLNLNPNLQTRFIYHPHYEVSYNKKIVFSSPKIKILIVGRYDFYMKDACDEAFDVFIAHPELSIFYQITFLGKGWESWTVKLQNVNYSVNHISFVPDYIKEIQKYDIQLTPITVGTGTKGKVLDAIANGLLVVGTLRALENIAVENNSSCICYESKHQLYDLLCHIPNNVKYYELIASRGRNIVLEKHGCRHISKEFFSLFSI